MPSSEAYSLSTPSPETAPAVSPALNIEASQAGLFNIIHPGELVKVPDYIGGTDTVFEVPTLDVVSPKGHPARLLSLHETHPQLQQMYETAGRHKSERLVNMTFEAVVRMLDTSGAEGLHHLHGTSFPETVYYNVGRGGGEQRSVYVTGLGKSEDGTPTIALITAVGDKKTEYKLFRLLGAGSQGRRRNP
jgi:hypothetical protein